MSYTDSGKTRPYIDTDDYAASTSMEGCSRNGKKKAQLQTSIDFG